MDEWEINLSAETDIKELMNRLSEKISVMKPNELEPNNFRASVVTSNVVYSTVPLNKKQIIKRPDFRHKYKGEIVGDYKENFPSL